MKDDLISIDSTCDGQSHYSKNSEHVSVSLYALKPTDPIEVGGSKEKLCSGYSKPVQFLSLRNYRINGDPLQN